MVISTQRTKVPSDPGLRLRKEAVLVPDRELPLSTWRWRRCQSGGGTIATGDGQVPNFGTTLGKPERRLAERQNTKVPD